MGSVIPSVEVILNHTMLYTKCCLISAFYTISAFDKDYTICLLRDVHLLFFNTAVNKLLTDKM